MKYLRCDNFLNMEKDTILYVEDDKALRVIFSMLLGIRYNVNQAVSVDEAIEKLNKNCSYDVIISDWKCPNTNDGQRLLEVAKENDILNKLIMLSANKSKAKIARDYGVYFLEKPVIYEDIESIIEKINSASLKYSS